MADNIVDDSGEIAIVDLKDGYEDVLRAVNGEAGHSEERVKQEDEELETLKDKKRIINENDDLVQANGTAGDSDEEEEKDLHHFSPREEETDSDEEEK